MSIAAALTSIWSQNAESGRTAWIVTAVVGTTAMICAANALQTDRRPSPTNRPMTIVRLIHPLDLLTERSLMKYDLLMPRQVVFGWGRRRKSSSGCRLGQRVFLVSGSRTLRKSALWSEIQQSLDTAKLQTVDLGVISREPEVEDVDSFVARLRDLGGGQPGDVVLSIAVAQLSILARRSRPSPPIAKRDVKDYLEGVGRGLQITERPLPLVAMPTTSGTEARPRRTQ